MQKVESERGIRSMGREERRRGGKKRKMSVGMGSSRYLVYLAGQADRTAERAEREGEDGRARSAVRLPFLPSRTLPAGCNRG